MFKYVFFSFLFFLSACEWTKHSESYWLLKIYLLDPNKLLGLFNQNQDNLSSRLSTSVNDWWELHEWLLSPFIWNFEKPVGTHAQCVLYQNLYFYWVFVLESTLCLLLPSFLIYFWSTFIKPILVTFDASIYCE